MTKWILGLWVGVYSLGAYGQTVTLDLENMKLSPAATVGVLAEQQPEPVEPVRMAKLNYKVIRAHFIVDENGNVMGKDEETNCIGTIEIPVYDFRNSNGKMILVQSTPCDTQLYGKDTRVSIHALIGLGRDMGRDNTSFVAGFSYDKVDETGRGNTFEFGSSNFSTRSPIEDAKMSVIPVAFPYMGNPSTEVQTLYAVAEFIDEQQ